MLPIKPKDLTLSWDSVQIFLTFFFSPAVLSKHGAKLFSWLNMPAAVLQTLNNENMRGRGGQSGCKNRTIKGDYSESGLN